MRSSLITAPALQHFYDGDDNEEDIMMMVMMRMVMVVVMIMMVMMVWCNKGTFLLQMWSWEELDNERERWHQPIQCIAIRPEHFNEKQCIEIQIQYIALKCGAMKYNTVTVLQCIAIQCSSLQCNTVCYVIGDHTKDLFIPKIKFVILWFYIFQRSWSNIYL